MEPDADETLVESVTSSLTEVGAGVESQFTVLPYDVYRNPLNVAGYTFTNSLTNKNDGRRVLGSIAFDEKTQRYIGKYQVKFAGDYIMVGSARPPVHHMSARRVVSTQCPVWYRRNMF